MPSMTKNIYRWFTMGCPMIFGFINAEGEIIDGHGELIKYHELSGGEIIRYRDLGMWSYHDWSNCYAGLCIKKDVCDATFTGEAIVITQEIKPRDQLQGGFVEILILSAFRALDMRKLKKRGFSHYFEIPTSEIAHVLSHKSGGYSIYIDPDEAYLFQVGFTKKTEELRRYLRPFRMDPKEWEKHRKRTIKRKKAEKRGRKRGGH